MNGDNSGVFMQNSESSTTHPHENSGATGVYHSKGNVSYEFHERRTGAPEFIRLEKISIINSDHGLS